MISVFLRPGDNVLSVAAWRREVEAASKGHDLRFKRDKVASKRIDKIVELLNVLVQTKDTLVVEISAPYGTIFHEDSNFPIVETKTDPEEQAYALAMEINGRKEAKGGACTLM